MEVIDRRFWAGQADRDFAKGVALQSGDATMHNADRRPVAAGFCGGGEEAGFFREVDGEKASFVGKQFFRFDGVGGVP